MAVKGFVFERVWWEAISLLPEHERLAVYDGILARVFGGERDGILPCAMAERIAGEIDAELERKAAIQEKRRAAGSMGGKAKAERLRGGVRGVGGVGGEDGEIGPIGFKVFWDAYDLKRDRRAAMRAWKSLPESMRTKAIEGISGYRERCAKEKIPMMYPQGYLSHRRWEDEPIDAEQFKKTSYGKEERQLKRRAMEVTAEKPTDFTGRFRD